MKTEKEITTELEMHNQRLTRFSNEYYSEKAKMFPNKKLLEHLKALMFEEQAAIVHLAWVLI